jgi:transportin-3
LNQVAPEHLPALQTTLIGALNLYHAGPRTIIVQLCLALSGLALQLSSWGSCVQDMIETFGRNPASVPALLQFLTVLPEEINGNFRIPITVSLWCFPSDQVALVDLMADIFVGCCEYFFGA